MKPLRASLTFLFILTGALAHTRAADNQPPVWDQTLPPQSARVDSPYNIFLPNIASDPDAGQTLTFSTTSTTALLSSATLYADGNFVWTPSIDGVFQITFSAKDNGNPILSTEMTIPITVLPNRPPTWKHIPDFTARLGVAFPLFLPLFGSDPDSQAVTYSTIPPTGLLTGAQLDANGGGFLWTPTLADVGSHIITFRVQEKGPQRLFADTTAQITVLPNRPPYWDTIPKQTVTVGTVFALNVNFAAHEPDTNQILKLSTASPTDIPLFFNKFDQWVWSPGLNDVGEHKIIFRATDNGQPPLSADTTVQVTVVPNNPPIWTGIPIQTLQVGASFGINISSFVTDPDGALQSLTLSTASGSDFMPGSGLTDNGIFFWTPNVEGSYKVVFRARDKGTPSLTADTTMQIIVNQNQPPVWGALPNQTVAVGTQVGYFLPAFASDNPGQTIGFSTVAPTDLLPGAQLSSDGSFLWTPTLSGIYQITFQARDNATPPLSAVKTIQITVTQNGTPAWAAIPTSTVTAGAAFVIYLPTFVTDPDNGQTLQLSTAFPTGLLPGSILSANGYFSWTPSAVNAGLHKIIVRAKDNGTPSLQADATMYINVIINSPPAWSNFPVGNAAVGSPFSFHLNNYASDLEGGPLTFSMTAPIGGLAGATLSSDGNFSWTPSTDAIGTQLITFRVEDNANPPNGVEKTMTVVVTGADAPGNQAPPVDINRNLLKPLAGETFIATVNASGADVSGEIYTMQGEKVADMVLTGAQTLEWNGTNSDHNNVASDVYVVIIYADGSVFKKMKVVVAK